MTAPIRAKELAAHLQAAVVLAGAEAELVLMDLRGSTSNSFCEILVDVTTLFSGPRNVRITLR